MFVKIFIIVLILIFCLSLIEVLRGIFFINKNVLTIKDYINLNEINRNKEHYHPDIYVLIAALAEDKTIYNTLKYFCELKYTGNLKIVVITSDKEYIVNQNNEFNTIYWLNKCINEGGNERILHIHYNSYICNKATQLNYAVEKLREKFELQDSYFAVYDADSRPDIHTFENFSYTINEAYRVQGMYPIVLQQPSMFYKNFNSVSRIMKLESLCMLRRVLGIEMYNQLKTVKNKDDIVFAYCVGHGMFVKSNYIINNGYFTEPHEDVPFGLICCMRKISIYPLRCFDDCEVAISLKELCKQFGRWFINSILVLKICVDEEKETLEKRLRCIVIFIKGIYDIFTWMHYSLLIWSSILLVLFDVLELWHLWIVVILMYLDVGMGTILVAKISNDKGKLKCGFLELLSMFFISPIRELIRVVGPMLGLRYIVKLNKNKDLNVMPKAKRGKEYVK